jgi:hypothetical protein
MRYQVPQFIEMEDKIIGPFTLKQFLYLITVPAVCFGLQYFVSIVYVILVGVIFFPIAIMLAFYKANGKPFIELIKGLVSFIRRPQGYTWKRMPQKSETMVQAAKTITRKNEKIIKNTDENSNFKKLAELLDSQKQ